MSFLSNLSNLNLSANVAKSAICAQIQKIISAENFEVVDENLAKPWGAYWRFDKSSARVFIAEFFPNLTLKDISRGIENAELSPKILLVAPQQRLSWQFHHRRAEIWRAVAGKAKYHKSFDDEQGNPIDFKNGETVQFDTAERHRLASGDGWSVVAEIWQHSNPENPSDESDIVRLADDYKR